MQVFVKGKSSGAATRVLSYSTPASPSGAASGEKSCLSSAFAIAKGIEKYLAMFTSGRYLVDKGITNMIMAVSQ